MLKEHAASVRHAGTSSLGIVVLDFYLVALTFLPGGSNVSARGNRVRDGHSRQMAIRDTFPDPTTLALRNHNTVAGITYFAVAA